jgi:hypothetical protein
MHSVQEIGFSNNIAIPFKSNEHCLEDGPLYRALIQQLENRTQTLKISVKKILKALDTLLEARQSLTQANDNYIDALQGASFTEPLMSHYLNSASSMIHEQQIQIEQMLGSKLIDTLKDIYQNDIKVAEMKRRQFEETSKDYYASLAKYLKSSKKKAESQQSKKGQFDLDRFDYLSFLMDLHGGKKEYEMIFAITDYARYDCHFYEETADQLVNERRGLDDLTAILKTSRREQETLTRERELKRNELVAKMELQVVDPLENRGQFNVYKDVETCDNVGHKKEGFLFATSKPVRNGNNFDTSAPWHK